MTTIGQIQEFDPEKEKVTAYLERVQMFLVANSIQEDKKVPVLLSVIGGKTYALLSSLFRPVARGGSRGFGRTPLVA